jgi:hypothetical protein
VLGKKINVIFIYFVVKINQLIMEKYISYTIEHILDEYKKNPCSEINYKALKSLDLFGILPTTEIRISDTVTFWVQPKLLMTKGEQNEGPWITVELEGGVQSRVFSSTRVKIGEYPKSKWLHLELANLYLPYDFGDNGDKEFKHHTICIKITTNYTAYGLHGGLYMKVLLESKDGWCRGTLIEHKGFGNENEDADIEIGSETNACLVRNRSHCFYSVKMMVRIPTIKNKIV